MLILHVGESGERVAIRAAVRVLQRGGVIALATETTYGLACDPRDAKAVKQIFRIKGRVESKPLQLIAGSEAQVRRLALMTSPEQKLAAAHWPGPLTLLVKLRAGKTLASKVSPKRVIGIRVSSSDFFRMLVRTFGHPIAATSANRSGNPPALSGRGVIKAFADVPQKPELVLDSGRIPRRKPSTVARVRKDGSIDIIRAGAVRLA